ncbi:MAG: allantoinase AllB [Candidatus Didemnitutus sp.]|nr:allantoinase AllB [Candidatus Didemnitutus sp.]
MSKKKKETPVLAPSHFDLVVRGGHVVTSEGIVEADLGIVDGQIVRVASMITEDASEVVEAHGRYVFPGIMDAHVHFNEPGRTDWEGIAHGSLALAAGGGTCFFDMPLNSEPPVIDAASLRTKRALAEEKSCTDFALWGGLVPGNLDRLAGLRDAGAIGLKAFMCHSGIDSFRNVDPHTLREGMKRAAKLGLIVAVHAEDDELAARYTAEQKAKGRFNVRAYLASRPVEVELAAIRQAVEFAGETGCALHVVHVSSPEGLALITEAKAQRVDVSAETCPHYLLFNEHDVVKLGAVAKCSPVIRDERSRLALWAELRAGDIQTIGSDHSPSPPALKTSKDFFAIWGGIAGVQHGFQLLFNECGETLERDLPLLAAVLARNVARRFRLDEHKGRLAEGFDADFTLLEVTKKKHTITANELWTQHRLSPYVGRQSRVRITHTYVRGQPIWSDGRIAPATRKGKFLQPQR